jgi:hypothetical protein
MRRSRFWIRGFAIPMVAVVLSYALIVRPWAMRWGATEAEVAMSLPGDSLAPAGSAPSTCAVTVHAPADEVWAWLVQLGQGRGGYYSYDWLENLFAADMRNADSIDPRLQTLRIGDTISFQGGGPFTRVAMLQPGRAMVLSGGWAFVLIPADSATTRFIVRYPYERMSGIGMTVFYHSIFEPAHFAMEVGMILGIKARAERSYRAKGPGNTEGGRHAD